MSPDNAPTTDDLHALAGEYVLGTLSAEASADVARRMERQPALREAVRAWEARLLPLTTLAPPVDPSPALWSRIVQSTAPDAARTSQSQSRPDPTPPTAEAAPAVRLASATPSHTDHTDHTDQTDQTDRTDRTDRTGWRRWWSSLGLWRALAGGGFATAGLLAALLAVRMNAPQAPQFMVVLVAPGDKAPGWVVQARANQQQLSLVPLGNAPIPREKALQFWTKADGWSGPVSLGLVEPGRPVTVPLDRLPPLQPNQLFELTLEPAAGSPIGRPTGPIQFIGRAVKVL